MYAFRGSAQVLGLFQNGLQLFDALIAQVVEGLAAVANGVAQQVDSLLDDGVGVAELEDTLQLCDGVLSFLSFLNLACYVQIIDGSDGLGPQVCTAGDAACAAILQAEEDVAVVAAPPSTETVYVRVSPSGSVNRVSGLIAKFCPWVIVLVVMASALTLGALFAPATLFIGIVI